MSESKPLTTTCNFCHGAESYGTYAKEVHKMFWYMAHTQIVTLEVLQYFEDLMIHEGDFLDALLAADGNSYPGME